MRLFSLFFSLGCLGDVQLRLAAVQASGITILDGYRTFGFLDCGARLRPGLRISTAKEKIRVRCDFGLKPDSVDEN